MLLKSIARILVKYAGNAAGFGVAGDAIIDIWDLWNKSKQDQGQKLEEIRQLAGQSTAEARLHAAEVVAQEAAGQPEAVRQELTAYLAQIPNAIAASQRRPQDPSGRTVSSQLRLTRPEDLLTLLPVRGPRFKVGDRPPGVGDWELEELLGMGGFGEVWKAKNPYMAERVALKFCLDPQAAKTLRHEAAVVGRVKQQGKQPGIVQLRHTYLSAEAPCLEYEFVSGGDLTSFVYQQLKRNQGKLPVEMVTNIMRRILRGVRYAHRLTPPIVHRDLKPANILVQRLPDNKIDLLIADFGIGGVAASCELKEGQQGAAGGQYLTTGMRGSCTPLYCSPQQAQGDPPDPRDDVHALGVIWYQLLVGDMNKPAGTDWHYELSQRQVPRPIIGLLGRCVSSIAERRPADAGLLADELDKLGPQLNGGGGGGGGGGDGIEHDMKDALEELRTRGDSRRFFERQGLTRIAEWRAAAEKGVAAAQWLLACCLFEGAGIQEDAEAALTWLRRAAEGGLPAAQTDLGDCYYPGGECYYSGESVKEDANEAVRLYTAAAAQGFPLAEADLGDCYYDGKGVAADLAEATRRYRKAAEAGWASGQYALGWCYDYGKGVTQNWGEAAKWFRKAAEQGHDESQVVVAYCYEHGRGVGQDLAQARQWYGKAADQGHSRAKNALARLLAGPKPPSPPEPPHSGTKGYWAIAPCSADPPEEWEQIWKFDLANGVISVGWEDLDDISSLDKQSLRKAIDRTYPDPETAAQARGQYFGMLWNFFHEIRLGDVVIAGQGRKKIAAVGTVTRTAYYDPKKAPAAVGDWYTYAYHLGVQWEPVPRDKHFDHQVFGMQTVSSVSEEKYHNLVGEAPAATVSQEE